MTEHDYIRGRLAEAVRMPATLTLQPPQGAELRARARRARTIRHSMVFGTVLMVVAIIAATLAVRPFTRTRATPDAPPATTRQLTTAVNVSIVSKVTAGPCVLGSTPSWTGDQCYSLLPEGTAAAPTNLRMLTVAGAKVFDSSDRGARGESARIVLTLRQADASTIGQLYRSGARLGVSVSGRMIVYRLQPSDNHRTLTLEAPRDSISWAWHALTVKEPGYPPHNTIWGPEITCEKGWTYWQPAQQKRTPLARICLPTTGAGFRNRPLEFGFGWQGKTQADMRRTAVAYFLVGTAMQPGNNPEAMTTPTGQEALIQISYAGYFAAHGDKPHTSVIRDHVTALGAPAVAVPGHNPGSMCVLVTTRGWDISACGSGRYKDLAPITTDQLVAILDSLRGI